MSFIVPADAKSWVEVGEESHFPIQNLPFGNALRLSELEHPDTIAEAFACVAIGDYVLDLRALAEAGLLPNVDPYAASLAYFAWEDPNAFRELRRTAYDLLRAENPRLRDDGDLRDLVLAHKDDVAMVEPFVIRAFVDFYSGINHASNVGKMFRPDQAPLLPNYRHLPVGYNGRASSVVVSGHPITRPNGQTKAPSEDTPRFGPTKELDFELEMGFFTGQSNDMGEPIPIANAEDYIVGFVLVNDWSARDVQRWEYQPLGPFLAKSFATSISPWVVTLDALEPFRCSGHEQDPQPLTHLRQPGKGHFDIHLEVSLQTATMAEPHVICRTNSRNLYWTFAQQLAHQTSNGTPVEVGDLYASGTISGTEGDSYGSLLELTWKGERPIHLPNGESRTFLEDGDSVTMTGWAQGEGFRVGFGEVTATVMPAVEFP